MIGKTTKGSNFDRLLDYIESKPGAEYVGGNMIGTTQTELVKEFQAIARRSYRVHLPVAHISLSPHPDEKLDDSSALDFAQSYLNKIHFGDCQWVLYQHNDTKTPEEKERPHFHIVANRVRITDGKAVSSWQDWRRSELALRELEKEFGLHQVQSSWETERSAPSTGQERRYKRQKKQYLAGERDLPPEKAIKSQIQEILDTVTLDKVTSERLTLPEVIKQLQQANMLTHVGFNDVGKVKGISYQFKGVSFSGSQLGKAYTFGGLQKYRNVSYYPEHDDPILHELMHLKPASFNPNPEFTPPLLVYSPSKLPESKPQIDLEQKARAEQLYPYAWRLFQYAKHRGMVKKMDSGVFCFKGENYALVHDELCSRFCVLHQGRGELLDYKPGELVSAQGIELRDIMNFLQFVEQQQRHRKSSKSSEIER